MTEASYWTSIKRYHTHLGGFTLGTQGAILYFTGFLALQWVALGVIPPYRVTRR